ncbi:hypothetical protein [Paracoccus zhejiangensis]|uniref:hypothetical protein n=1 Tax=Paracoccus zhejiangensis TaxID=1077935 RepID=UPI0012FFFEE6|nr:hypothetical protein [Paracoccus zhejiangensis]
MSSMFRNSAAILALVAGLGGAAYAQTATPPATETAPAAPEATSPAPAAPAAPVEITEDNLPDLLKSLNLQNIDIDRDRRSVEVEGDLADGTQIEAHLDRQGQLRKIEADDDAALPAAVIEALIPEAVRNAEMYGQFANINEIGLPPADAPMKGVMIEGADANGEELRALFAEDGTLTRFGRGDDDRGPRGERHGDRGGKHGDHGKRGHDMRGGPDGGRDGGPDRAGMGGQPPAPLDEAAVTTTLTEAGYAELGAITRDGPRTLVEAVNAAGETVTVELSPRGEVVRETAR